MNIETFEHLRRYPTTSWAIWHEFEDCSVEFFREQVDRLHGRVVFLGLNRSEAWPDEIELTHMPNFHTPGHVGDRRLRRFIQAAKLENLIGGFMTDLSDEILSRSDLVKIDLDRALPILIEKIMAVDASSLRSLVCFGDKVFDNLQKGLGVSHRSVSFREEVNIRSFETLLNDERWSVFRVWHPGNYGRYRDKSEIELPLQLRYINQQML